MKKILITGLRAGKTALIMKLQLFANLDEIITQNTQAFEGSNVKDSFTSISTKLSELGYDILINNKKQSEFVPISRLNEVVGQRDNFKSQFEGLNSTLETMKKGVGDNEVLKKQIEDQQKANETLLKDLDNMKVQTEIITAAKDAINPKDVMAFINMDSIKVSAKGEILGVESEIKRLREEKPYLFGTADTTVRKKLGMDNGGGGGADKLDMNSMIRRAAGRV